MKKILHNIIKRVSSALLGKSGQDVTEINRSENPEIIQPLKNIVVLLGGIGVRVQSGVNSAAGVNSESANASSNDLTIK